MLLIPFDKSHVREGLVVDYFVGIWLWYQENQENIGKSSDLYSYLHIETKSAINVVSYISLTYLRSSKLEEQTSELEVSFPACHL